MHRLLLLLSCLVPVAALWACSCAETRYTPFCEVLENARQQAANILVVRVTDLDEETVGLQIETELAGEAPFGEFRFRRGNGANCGIPLREARVGSRYLGIFQLTPDRTEYSGFVCAYRQNMLPIDNGLIEYGNDWNRIREDDAPPQLYYDLEALQTTGECRPAGHLATALRLWPNPTPGTLTLDTLTTPPTLRYLELYDLAGRRIERRPEPLDFPYQMQLRSLPAGVYLLHVVADRQRRVFRIVKA